ncbi:MAG: recombinase family protein [Pseudonocardiaceae bacterium]
MDSGRREQRGGSGRARGGGSSEWVDQSAAIYCRISKARDEDQTGVDRQERLCREVADRLGLVVGPRSVFVDNNRSAWQRTRHRPGWDALLEAIRAGRMRHVIVYHPDRLMRQPRDLEELLGPSDERNITLHGQANRRDLSDPDDRFFLRIEVAHACRSSDDTSRRLRAALEDRALEDRAREGRPHSTSRRFGYERDGVTVVPEEARVVREIFGRYLDGAGFGKIAQELNTRGERTRNGKLWQADLVRELLGSRYVTGIRVFRGEDFSEGDWPAIIDRGMWNEVQERRAYRASASASRSSFRLYLLRGLVMCKRCGLLMRGTTNRGIPTYLCGRNGRLGPERCKRRIDADMVENFVCDAAVELLTHLDVTGQPTAVTALSAENENVIAAEEQELAELTDMWTQRELSTREYRRMRKVVDDRISVLRRRTVVRPTAEVLAGLVGSNARTAWDELAARGDKERMNAVLRFLFAAVIIDEHRGKRGRFNYARIDIDPNPL